MKRLGFLGAMGGALAAAALPIPKLPAAPVEVWEIHTAEGISYQLPEMLVYSQVVTLDCIAWMSLNAIYKFDGSITALA